MDINLYTAQETEWLDKILQLFEIKPIITEIKDTISYTRYTINTDTKTCNMIKQLMRYNYEKKFIE